MALTGIFFKLKNLAFRSGERVPNLIIRNGGELASGFLIRYNDRIKKIRGEQQIPWKIKSEEQVQNVSNEFLEKKLGKDFVNQYFEYVEVQRLSDTSIFRVVYHFTSNGYSLDMFLSFDPTAMMFKDYIDWEGSLIIHSPQEINVTENEAISIASQLIDSQGPFHTRLEVKTVYNYRIVWVVITEEELPAGNAIGVIIDAEDGRAYKKIYNFMGESNIRKESKRYKWEPIEYDLHLNSSKIEPSVKNSYSYVYIDRYYSSFSCPENVNSPNNINCSWSLYGYNDDISYHKLYLKVIVNLSG